MKCYKLVHKVTGEVRLIWSFYGDWEVYDYPKWTPETCSIQEIKNKIGDGE